MFSQIVVGVISAALAGPIGAWLALRRFYSERLWERKLDAYMLLTESLHLMLRPYDEAIDANIEQREISKSMQEELDKKSTEAYAEVLKQLDMSELIISREAADVLRSILRKLDEARSVTDYVGYILAKQGAITEGLKDLKAVAKKDLGLNRWRSFLGG